MIDIWRLAKFGGEIGGEIGEKTLKPLPKTLQREKGEKMEKKGNSSFVFYFSFLVKSPAP